LVRPIQAQELTSQAETGPATPASGSYSYDPAGNLTGTPDGATLAYDADSEVTTTHNPAAGTVNYSYGSDGDRSSAVGPDGATSYGYDQADRLTTYTAPAAPAGSGITGPIDASYSYNGDGLRMSKTVNGVTSQFTYDTTTSVPEVLTDGTNSYVYGLDGTPIEQTNNTGATVWLQQDQQGSTTLLTGQAGITVGTYDYDPYGNSTSHTGIATPLEYDGNYTDAETGLQYDINRYYDPTTAQFLTQDPLVTITGEPYVFAGITTSTTSTQMVMIGRSG
jgi:RHS repeat-associated protein